MAVVPRFYDSTDTSIVASLTFPLVSPGNVTPFQELHLWNNKGGVGAETIRNGRIRILAQEDALSPIVSQGLDILDYRAVQVRLIGGQGVGPFTPTGIRNVGAGAFFDFPELQNDEAVHLEFALAPPAGFDQPNAVTIFFRVESERYQPLATGVFESSGSLIRLGIGDGDMNQILAFGDVEATGTPDDEVHFPDLVWIGEGDPFVLLAHAVALDNLDGDAVALDPGEGYVAIFAAAADGTISEARGSKATLPLTAEDDPIPPDGIPLTRVEREEDGSIEQADISNLSTIGGGGVVEIVGRVVTIGAVDAIIGTNRVRMTHESSVTAPPSTTSRLWVLPTGGLEAVDVADPRPDPRAAAFYEVTTDATSVLSIVDLRNFGEQFSIAVPFRLPAPVANDAAEWFNASGRSVFLRPLRGVAMRLTDDPGAASGNWIGDVEKSIDGGATWTSLFVSQGTDDRRPTIPFDGATNVAVAAYAEEHEIESGALVRFRLDAVAVGGTPDAVLAVLFLEVPR